MHGILLPEEIVRPFIDIGHKRVKVTATFEGKSINFHAALQKYHGTYNLTFGKDKQKELGIFQNDYFTLQFFEDNSKYGVEMPEELEAVLLSDHDAFKIFESLTDGKKRSIIYMISRYKVSQTRIDKSLILVDNIKMGITDNKFLLKKP